MKFTKRDLAFFLLGFATLFIIETLMDWEGSKATFKQGFENTQTE
ncbi:hypothetical protein [Sediminicola luteus]|nr:hypothetical protein [Sediminicola luteus]